MEYKKSIAIVSPCYNEGRGIELFLLELQAVLEEAEADFRIIIVDDSSSDDTLRRLKEFAFTNVHFQLSVIKLKYNMGHQEAIRQGLVFANNLAVPFDKIVVMDSDGEDDPKAILKVLDNDELEIVFFKRGKRKEGLLFKIGYFTYRFIFFLITGKKISFGNYTVINYQVLKSISNQKYFHYAGFLSKQKFAITKIKFDRQKRLDGKSKMNYDSLVVHGLKSFIEYSDQLLIFFIKALIGVSTFSVVAAVVILYKKFISNEAISGWTSSLGIGLVTIFLVILTSLFTTLMLLSIKNAINQSEANFDEIR